MKFILTSFIEKLFPKNHINILYDSTNKISTSDLHLKEAYNVSIETIPVHDK
jgi:hypothetical protein